MAVDIAVIGSFVIESAIRLERMPVVGETLVGDKYYMAPGGKGTNQAIAAVRQGKDVGLVVKIGKDLFADFALNLYKKEGVDLAGVFQTEESSTAIGLVYFNPSGENCIGLYTGANDLLTGKEVESVFEKFMPAKVVTAQLESPDEAILTGFRIGRQHGSLNVLNTAPAREIDPQILEYTDIMTPNETEAKLLVGLAPDDSSVGLNEIGAKLLDKGLSAVIITLGSKGSMLFEKGKDPVSIDSYKVDTVDTLGAGDCFSGSLCAALSEGKSLIESVEWACVAAALKTLGNGGIAPLPQRETVEEHLKIYRTRR
jgi:ribokinase